MFRDNWKSIGGSVILRPYMKENLPTVMVNPKLWHMIVIELSSGEELIDEICAWLEQYNILCTVCNSTSNTSHFYFANEADAVAFKLRWI